MLDIWLDNRDGNVWNISQLVSGVEWRTSRMGKPGSLAFTLICSSLYGEKAFKYSNGDIVTLSKDGHNVFYGYIFSVDEGRSEAVKIKAYDQIRYLLNTDTYVFSGATASDILRKIASDFQLRLGIVEDTGYPIPSMAEDGKKLLDMICKALTLTLIHGNRNYVLFDDYGALSIRNVESMLLDFIIGDESLLYDYQLTASIDSNTYNRVKLYRDNKDTGRREVYIEQDSANIARWGLLQLYESVDENMNPAQINEHLRTMMQLRNRESKTLKLSAIGDIRVRAGCYVRLWISEYGINMPFLVDECAHRFDGADHTMSLEMVMI